MSTRKRIRLNGKHHQFLRLHPKARHRPPDAEKTGSKFGPMKTEDTTFGMSAQMRQYGRYEIILPVIYITKIVNNSNPSTQKYYTG